MVLAPATVTLRVTSWPRCWLARMMMPPTIANTSSTPTTTAIRFRLTISSSLICARASARVRSVRADAHGGGWPTLGERGARHGPQNQVALEVAPGGDHQRDR